MKHRGLDDRQLKILLGDYRRPDLKPEALAALSAAADRLDRQPPKVVRPVFGGWLVKGISMAAGLLLVLGILGLFLLRGPAAGEGLSSVALDGSRTVLPAVSHLVAGTDALFVEVPGQQVALAGGSVLDVDASDPARVVYHLDSGSLRLRHQAGGKSSTGPAGGRDPARGTRAAGGRTGGVADTADFDTADFVLGFPGGRVWPRGTELAIQVQRGETRVWCLEGALAFEPDSAPGGILEIHAGQVLVVALEGSTQVLDFGSDPTGPAPQMLPMTPWEADAGSGTGGDEAGLETDGLADRDQGPGTAGIEGTPVPAGSDPNSTAGATASTQPADAARSQAAGTPGKTGVASPVRQVWSRPAPAGTHVLALRSGVVLALADDGITTFKASDGSEIARLALKGKPASWGATDRLVIIYEARTLTAWTLPGLTPAWSAATGNLAFTDFSLGRDLLYLPSAEGKLYQHRLTDGSLAANPDLGAGSYGRILESPGRATVSTLRKELVNLDTASGARNWSAALPFRPVDDQPLALGSLIIEAGPEGLILALDAATGTKAWEFRLPGELEGRLILSGNGVAAKTASRVWLIDARGKGRPLAESDLDLLGATRSGNLVLGGRTGLVVLRTDGSTLSLTTQAVQTAAAGSPDDTAKPEGSESWFVLGKDGQIRLLEFTP